MIRENHRPDLPEFIRLNEAWIAKYFQIEDTDRKLAANPGRIIDAGGYVFSLLQDDRVVAVCALFHEGEGVYELARMAVAEAYQGRGLGDLLIRRCIEKLSEIGAKRVYLVSNTKLEPAIKLYRKYGFNAVHEGTHPVYQRANIVMERLLS